MVLFISAFNFWTFLKFKMSYNLFPRIMVKSVKMKTVLMSSFVVVLNLLISDCEAALYQWGFLRNWNAELRGSYWCRLEVMRLLFDLHESSYYEGPYQHVFMALPWKVFAIIHIYTCIIICAYLHSYMHTKIALCASFFEFESVYFMETGVCCGQAVPHLKYIGHKTRT